MLFALCLTCTAVPGTVVGLDELVGGGVRMGRAGGGWGGVGGGAACFIELSQLRAEAQAEGKERAGQIT